MKTIHAFLFVLSAAIAPASIATAGHATPLKAAACRYHETVRQFECTVRDVRFIDPCDAQLVHSLVDASCALRDAAACPTRVNEIQCRWRDVQILHRGVARAVFGRSCYPPHPLLIKCWDRVSCAYRELSSAIECLCRERHALRAPTDLVTSLGYSSGRPAAFGFPGVAGPAPIPSLANPGVTSPRAPLPPVGLPHALGPTTPSVDRHVRPEITPRNPSGPWTDDIRYFGPRHSSHPRGGRHNINAHFTGNDLNVNDFRAAMISAMLSRLLQ